MKRNTQIETKRETLKRIVAMLFSMAVLADLVSARPRRVRCDVLALLRNAEIVGWSIALEDAYGLFAPPELIAATFSSTGNRPDDARRLAVILRALALTLTLRFALHRNLASAQEEGPHTNPSRRTALPVLSLNPERRVERPSRSASARSPPDTS